MCHGGWIDFAPESHISNSPLKHAMRRLWYDLSAMCLPVSAGPWGFRAAWLYGAAMVGIVLVRTLKRVMFYEARQYAVDSSRHNYLLLGLWAFQFPFAWWLSSA